MTGIRHFLSETDSEDKFLPALPAAWPNGKVTGLCSRSGKVYDIEWKDGKII